MIMARTLIIKTPILTRTGNTQVSRRTVATNTKQVAEVTARALLNELWDENNKLVLAQERVEQIKAEIKELLETNGVDNVKGDAGSASLEIKYGNAKNHIDPGLLYKKVPLNTFFNCVDVVKARASKFLASIELEEITEVTPGKAKPPELVITLNKRKRNE